jgi:L-aspartate oxidase
MDTDVLILGSGLAGLRLALGVADGARVTIITKRGRLSGSSRHAQGGIAAAWDDEDDWRDHVADTVGAGAGLCHLDVVERTAREAKARVQELIDLGVEFDRQADRPEAYDLHQEGGHSARRILHTKDITGAEIMRALVAKAEAHPNIRLLEDRMGIDLITEGGLARRRGEPMSGSGRVIGAYVLDIATETVEVYAARVVALCTGGAGKVYIYTSNPDEASGDGIAMGWRAGAEVANMEFVQFHPTCLFHPEAGSFLISEALRGEGGKLRHADGSTFMAAYDEREELAPRDIVARAIDAELKRTGGECVFLDMTHLSRAELEHKFPNIVARCGELGIDVSTEPIPVVPAAHYTCGGIRTNLDGESSVPNLFAVGEVSCTGLHGANRLASNSLLEAISFAHHAALAIRARLAEIPAVPVLPLWEVGQAVAPDEQVVITQVWDELRRFMWNYVGIVRTTRRLMRAARRIALVREEIRQYYWDFQVTGDLVELRNLATVADLVVRGALARRESRGLHFTLDHPQIDPDQARDTVLKKVY